MENPLTIVRSLVSKKKRRWEEDGFNLDLTYITDQIIAMGFPSEGTEGLFRNPLSEVQRFLQTRHAGNFHVYNLCIERSYKIEKFDGRVSVYPFADHNAPSLQMIRDFCVHVHEWLSQNPRNVAAVHCKAGKGRTGTMICCYLMYCGAFKSVDDCLEFYGVRRTHNGAGVTIPSQRRYVQYYSETLSPTWDFAREKIAWSLRRIDISSIPRKEDGTPLTSWHPLFGVTRKDKTLLYVIHDESSQSTKPTFLCDGLPVVGDIKFELFNGKCTKRLFWFWLNTAFIPAGQNSITLTKKELDGAVKDKEHKIFPADFQVTIHFERVAGRARNKGSKAPPPSTHVINQIIRSSSPSKQIQSPTLLATASSAQTSSSQPLRSPTPPATPTSDDSNLCSVCNLSLTNGSQIVQSQGKNYHWACMTCSVCQEPFGERKSCTIADTTTVSQALICANCDTNFWVKCAVCKHALTGDNFATVSGIGKLCQRCFSCCICHAPFSRTDEDEYDEDVDAFDIVQNKLICRSHSESSRKIWVQNRANTKVSSSRILSGSAAAAVDMKTQTNTLTRSPSSSSSLSSADSLNSESLNSVSIKPPRPSGFNINNRNQNKLSLRKMRGLALEMERCALCCGLIDITAESIYVEQTGKHYHSNHFKCNQCQNVILSADLYHVSEVGNIQCNDCFRQSAKCCKCSLPISGHHKQIGPELYVHAQCFKCDECSQEIQTQYMETAGKTLCIHCATKKTTSSH